MLDRTNESRAMTYAEREAAERKSLRQHDHSEGWTDERIDELTRLWADGNSASEIANALGGGLTRSAVLGKVHRLKLPQRPTLKFAVPKPKHHGNRGQPKANAIMARKARKVAASAPLIADEPFEDDGGEGVDVTRLIGILQLTEHTCKWPVGDPKMEGFGFCGLHSADGKPYCAEHAARAYQGFTPGYPSGKRP